MVFLLGLERPFQPDRQGFVENIRREGTPRRVYNIELFHDPEVIHALVERFGLVEGMDRGDPDFPRHKTIAFQRFCGLDYVRVPLDLTLRFHRHTVEDTAALKRAGAGSFRTRRPDRS